ncbi:helix-turn-helix transcriptional regulator [Castellaniella ginsengisoli]|uniref:Helix-turn-helix transcriptional regulator n=1 Tax=Castellaniella ginsengisoli TaxID=546114 RepID=A0AB39E1M8_9BURK
MKHSNRASSTNRGGQRLPERSDEAERCRIYALPASRAVLSRNGDARAGLKRADRQRLMSAAHGEKNSLEPAVQRGAGEPDVLTVLAGYQFGRLVSANRPGGIPAEATIPREVLALASSHGWGLLRAWREYLWLSKEEVARRADISVAAYAEIETNFTHLGSDVQARVAALFGLQLPQLGRFDVRRAARGSARK